MKIMVVDDEPSVAEALMEYLSFRGHQVEIASCGSEALAGCSSGRPDLVILDQSLPGASGIQLIPKLKEISRKIRVVILTGFPGLSDAREAGQKGAEAYLAKPVDFVELDRIAMEDRPEERNPVAVGPAMPLHGSDSYLALDNGPMRRIYDHIRKAARMKSVPVLVSGETGTGKKHVAELMHAFSGRDSKPFVPVNCGAIPESLFEAELFGYEAGAFTDARKGKPGLLEQARGGTLFLDEIAEMSAGAQAKLLNAIEQKKARRLGSQSEVNLDFQLVSASNRDLGSAVKDGRFRQDLYFRLRGIEIRLPALRSMPEDIDVLADFFLRQANAESGLNLQPLDSEIMDLLRGYSWPGNIRELRNAIFSAVALSDGDRLSSTHLPSELLSGQGGVEAIMTHAEVERESTARALIAAKGNRSLAAKLLGLTRQTVAKRIKKYAIQMPRQL